MRNYFKIVSLNGHRNKEWMIKELRNGRLRFGWSDKNSNLIDISKKDNKNENEKNIWRHCQFILNRLEENDIVIIQLERPMREFMIAKIVSKDSNIYEFDGEEEDFNSIINCELITENPVKMDSKYISKALVHDLTKRGNYYKIYDENAINEIENIIENRLWEKEDFNTPSKLKDDIERTKDRLVKDVIGHLQNEWKSKDFEKIVTTVFNAIDGVSAENRDSGKGWDIIVKIDNPLMKDDPLELPVQCKNYKGEVSATRAIEDLERCIKGYGSNSAYLVILGDLTENFLEKLSSSEEKLSKQLNTEIKYKLIGQEDFAKLYLSVIDKI